MIPWRPSFAASEATTTAIKSEEDWVKQSAIRVDRQVHSGTKSEARHHLFMVDDATKQEGVPPINELLPTFATADASIAVTVVHR